RSERARVEGTAALHRRLSELDPKAADTILPTDTRRIVRALEVITLTGEPFSANLPEPGPPRYGTVLIGVDRAVDELDERVERRVERMFAAGLVDGARRWEEQGHREGTTTEGGRGGRLVFAAL